MSLLKLAAGPLAYSQFPFYYYNYCYFSNSGSKSSEARIKASWLEKAAGYVSLPFYSRRTPGSEALRCYANYFNVLANHPKPKGEGYSSFSEKYIFLDLKVFSWFLVLYWRQPKRAGNAKVPNGDRCTLRWRYYSRNTRRLDHILSIYTVPFRMVSTETTHRTKLTKF